MTIHFKETHMPLFKSRKQLDGLLKDDNLANVSLADLMSSCRQRLPLKTGEEITDDQDLVLSFDQLALMLVEVSRDISPCCMTSANNPVQDSRAASSTSLNEVLQIYLQLHQNDGVEEIASLSLTLSTQLRFSSSLTMFRQAIANGQGMSHFDFLQAPAEDVADPEQYPYEEGDDWTGLAAHEQHDHLAEQHFDDTTYHEQETTSADNAAVQHEQHAGEDDQHHGTEQDLYFDETGRVDYDEAYEGEAAEALDGLTGQTDGEAYDFQEYAQAQDNGDGQHESTEAETAAAPDEEGSTSTSTTTLKAKETANTTGEYDDEELIDWDEECLTTYESDNTGVAKQGKTTISTNYDDVEAEPQQEEQPQMASEDWLNNLAGYQDGQNGVETHTKETAMSKTSTLMTTLTIRTPQNLTTKLWRQLAKMPTTRISQHCSKATENTINTARTTMASRKGVDYEHGLENTDLQDGSTELQDEEEEFDDTVLIHRPEEGHFEGDFHEDTEAQHQDEYDDLTFDDDETDGEHPTKAVAPTTDATTSKDLSSGSPNGKRSFDEIDDLEDESVELPEVKKVRSS